MPPDGRADHYWRLLVELDGDAHFLVNLLALLPFGIRVTEAQRRADNALPQIPRQRRPHPREITTPGPPPELWPRHNVRYPPAPKLGGPT